MEQTLFDSALVIGRILTILPLLLIVTILMGRRSIGEVPVFDFLVVLTLGAIAGSDIADPTIPHIHTAVAIVAVTVLQKIVARWTVRSRRFGRLITFEPVIVIHKGQFLVANLKSINYSIDNVLPMMRAHDVFDVREVEMGIVEANGKLTVLKKSDLLPVTRQDAGMQVPPADIAYPVIVDGFLYKDVLQAVDLDEQWLHQQLKQRGITDSQEIFFASVTKKQELHVSLKYEPMNSEFPPLLH